MRTLREDGLLKARQGLTSLAEIAASPVEQALQPVPQHPEEQREPADRLRLGRRRRGRRLRRGRRGRPGRSAVRRRSCRRGLRGRPRRPPGAPDAAPGRRRTRAASSRLQTSWIMPPRPKPRETAGDRDSRWRCPRLCRCRRRPQLTFEWSWPLRHPGRAVGAVGRILTVWVASSTSSFQRAPVGRGRRARLTGTSPCSHRPHSRPVTSAPGRQGATWSTSISVFQTALEQRLDLERLLELHAASPSSAPTVSTSRRRASHVHSSVTRGAQQNIRARLVAPQRLELRRRASAPPSTTGCPAARRRRPA